MGQLTPGKNKSLLFLLLLAQLLQSGANERTSSTLGHALSTNNMRTRREAFHSRPHITFDTKTLVCLPLQRSKTFRISTTILSTSRTLFQWMKTTPGLLRDARPHTADRGRQLVLEPPFSEDDSGTYSVVACNRVGCSARGVRVIFYVAGDQLFENKTRKHSDNGLTVLALVGGITAFLALVCLIIASVVLRRYWTRWIFMKKVKAEYHSQTSSLHGGNDPCSWLWTWRTASQAGFHASDEEDFNEYDDPLRLNTRKAERNRKKRKKSSGAAEDFDNPSFFEQLHNNYHPPLPSAPELSEFQQSNSSFAPNEQESLVESSEGQTAAPDSSKDGRTASITSNERTKQLSPTRPSIGRHVDVRQIAEWFQKQISGTT